MLNSLALLFHIGKIAYILKVAKKIKYDWYGGKWSN